eukprot:scaffold22691_cov62-Phaeocystis_antarctica.AAC.3
MWLRSMNKLDTGGCEAAHAASLMMTSPKLRRTQLKRPGTPMPRSPTAAGPSLLHGVANLHVTVSGKHRCTNPRR